MADAIEVELVNGERAWPETQQAFAGVTDDKRARIDTRASWYSTDIHPREGAFALVKSGTPLEDFVGDIVEVEYQDQRALVYVVGTNNRLPTDFALARRAFMALEVLSEQEIAVSVQPVIVQ